MAMDKDKVEEEIKKASAEGDETHRHYLLGYLQCLEDYKV
jgi:hypothetical protein